MQKNQNFKKIYGTTIFIGEMQVQTLFGPFTTYTFQDLINKGYIIALCHGDINAKVLYTRMHSSCVTSETMRSLDCDCVSQLYSALKKIGEGENNGILFYLIQQGRGCGYVGKSRACMMVQQSENTPNQLNTFQAYEALGMKHDYRSYTNIKDICSILNIDPEFILLTNNPDKIEKFNKIGLKLNGVQSIEITPNPFNQQYLKSKQHYGHILFETKTKVAKYHIPYPKIKSFTPYSLQDCQRFIHVSSYYLPIKPVDNNIILTEDEFNKLRNQRHKEFKYQIINYPGNTVDNILAKSYLVHIPDNGLLQKYKELLCKPYWFKVNVYYDIATNTQYLVLQYGDCKNKQKTPVVRIHSQSIFNRFPLIDRQYKNRYKRSLDHIIRNGCGIIIILYNDGRGSGLGYYILNKQKTHKVSIGVQEQRRDYNGAIKLMEHYINKEEIIDILHGSSSKQALEHVLKENNIKVGKWIDISQKSVREGHDSIYKRIVELPSYSERLLNEMKEQMPELLNKLSQKKLDKKKICITGIGSSQAHARFLYSFLEKRYNIQFVSSVDAKPTRTYHGFQTKYDILIIFTQGMSPNTNIPLSKFNYQNIILITTVKEGQNFSAEKIQKFNKIKADPTNIIITYPPENPDDTLIRISGPFGGYLIATMLHDLILRSSTELNQQTSDIIISLDQIKTIDQNAHYSLPEDFVRSLAKYKKLLIVADPPQKEYLVNIKNKFMEGAFIDVLVCDSLQFTHGTFQLLEHNRKNGILFSILIINKQENQQNANTVIKKLKLMIQKTYPLCLINVQSNANSVLEMQMQTNMIVFQLIQILEIDQKDWAGKQAQKELYTIESL